MSFTTLFPELPPEVDKDLRLGYRGGWTYLNPRYANKILGSGIVIDRNSMYPATLYDEVMPWSYPLFFEGKYKPDPVFPLYVQQLTCSFKLKKHRFPSIQIKNSMYYRQNEWLETTNGDLVTLNLTNFDLKMLFKNYDVEVYQYHGGWKFQAIKGTFKNYIDKWTEIKVNSKKEGKPAQTACAKLMLNSTYGKFGTNPIRAQKIPYLDEGILRFKTTPEKADKSVYLPVAMFTTSQARCCIINTSQKIRDYGYNKYGKDVFIYADTDSVHCLLDPSDVDQIEGLEIDKYKLGAWDLETIFTRGKYIRQKCYIEQVDQKISAHVAGLPEELARELNFENFHIGFSTEELPASITEKHQKLRYKQCKGGVVLVDTPFSIT